MVKKRMLNFSNFEIKKIPRCENSHIDALATLPTIHVAKSNQIISIIVLTKASMEDIEILSKTFMKPPIHGSQQSLIFSKMRTY